jgi:hypothetical protein
MQVDVSGCEWIYRRREGRGSGSGSGSGREDVRIYIYLRFNHLHAGVPIFVVCAVVIWSCCFTASTNSLSGESRKNTQLSIFVTNVTSSRILQIVIDY